MTLTFKFLYNEITGQAWSMFDGEVESKEEFETSVTTSIQKALTDLWFSFKFEFRKKTNSIKTRDAKAEYLLPLGQMNDNSVSCNGKSLTLLEDTNDLEDKKGEPESFYIKNNKLCLYPTPDNVYTISVEYLSSKPAKNEDEEEISNLKEDTDYVNIDEQYEDLFKETLLPLSMVYLIASETDENYSAYMWQYERAFKKLKKCTTSLKKERVKGW